MVQELNFIAKVGGRKVRTRYAPSPTGYQHIGGIRTALFSYLHAKKHNGHFILRIEDTDNGRFVEGAEKYILDSLKWLGISPDNNKPFRQSDRLDIYKDYAYKLVEEGKAYYAFDTSDDLDAARDKVKGFVYNSRTRGNMVNSFTLSNDTIQKYLKEKDFVIRLNVPSEGEIKFNDLIRGNVSFDLKNIDDKIILKSDGYPTYHLASTVDDYLMDITHVIRGEEWLTSIPIHLLLWDYLGFLDKLPEYAHLPLVLKPNGKGKISKRDAEVTGVVIHTLGYCVDGVYVKGLKDIGFSPEAVLNFLAFLGWHPGGSQEILSKTELIEKFDLSKVNKSGARFNPDKANYFNKKHIQLLSNERYLKLCYDLLYDDSCSFPIENLPVEEVLDKIFITIKPRVSTLTDIFSFLEVFNKRPEIDTFGNLKPSITDVTHINSFIELIRGNKNDITITELENYLIQLNGIDSNYNIQNCTKIMSIFLCGKSAIDIKYVIPKLGVVESLYRIVDGFTKFKSIYFNETPKFSIKDAYKIFRDKKLFEQYKSNADLKYLAERKKKTIEELYDEVSSFDEDDYHTWFITNIFSFDQIIEFPNGLVINNYDMDYSPEIPYVMLQDGENNYYYFMNIKEELFKIKRSFPWFEIAGISLEKNRFLVIHFQTGINNKLVKMYDIENNCSIADDNYIAEYKFDDEIGYLQITSTFQYVNSGDSNKYLLVVKYPRKQVSDTIDMGWMPSAE
jgi:glutamyl-tRNA synthetase